MARYLCKLTMDFGGAALIVVVELMVIIRWRDKKPNPIFSLNSQWFMSTLQERNTHLQIFSNYCNE